MSLYEKQLAYRARVRAFVRSLGGVIAADDTSLVEDLIDHDEIGEALTSLAWIIVEKDLRIPRSAMDEFHRLGDGLVSPEYLPEGFESHVVPASS